jgi:hypothetical protein
LIEPNLGNGTDHIYNIGAHKGNHSRDGQGVIKFKIKEMLEAQDKFDYYMNLEHGIFLIRLKKL